ncbi:hypothetical protein [Sediminitomix flava]|uniref:DnaJ-like protein n=1 Tax=Sediminitomix flava TaxID=379075 RepID=A0A315Z877_SEDFL|nr:hypothetical protein [Sediminitomix flava]PWJ40868.1 hypothetical protein BC781_104128 [Sediminitomix flava]
MAKHKSSIQKKLKKDKKKSVTPLSTYRNLLGRIEIKKKRNEKLSKELSHLLQTYEKNIAPHFKGRHESVSQIVDLLIFHLSDPSLNAYQVSLIQDWIQECFYFLSDSSFAHTEKYQKLYEAYVGQLKTEIEEEDTHAEEVYTFVRKSAEEELGVNLETFLNEKEILAFCQNPNAFVKAYAHKFEKALQIQKPNKEEEATSDLEQHNEQKNVLKNTSVNDLYKKLAKVLHPDLEPNEFKKEDKHELMSSLVIAKKENDLSTIMKLYQEHIDDAEFEFAESELEKMIPLLKKKEASLEKDFERMKSRSPQVRWIMEHIYGRTSRSIEKKMEQVKANMKNEVLKDQKFAEQISTIKGLKYELETNNRKHFIGL